MSAAMEVPEIPDDQHPAMLLARAHEITREADKLAEQVKAKRAEASLLQARAERLKDGMHLAPVKKKAEPPDPLLSAAALATEDLPGYWTIEDLMALLEIRNRQRGVRIVMGLTEMNLIVKVEDRYRTVDPDEGRVRDELKTMGTGSQVELAERLEMPRVTLDYYLELGVARGWCSMGADGHLMYLKPGPERIITKYPVRRPPEKEPPAGLLAPKRGEPVRLEDHAKRGKAGSLPGQRHRLKMRDKRREEMDAARASRSERDKAKSAANRNGGKRKR